MAVSSLPPKPLFKDVTKSVPIAARVTNLTADVTKSYNAALPVTKLVTEAPLHDRCPECGQIVKRSAAERQRRSRANRKRIGIK